MMKPREELLQGYIYLSNKFHECGTITKDFQDRVELISSTRDVLKNPSPQRIKFKVFFSHLFLKSHDDVLQLMFIKATSIVNSKIPLRKNTLHLETSQLI